MKKNLLLAAAKNLLDIKRRTYIPFEGRDNSWFDEFLKLKNKRDFISVCLNHGAKLHYDPREDAYGNASGEEIERDQYSDWLENHPQY